MNNLLIFFAIPIAVIIFSIALQKIFKCPVLVAAIIFAIFLVVTFAIGKIVYLVLAIAYTVLSFITAWLTCVVNKVFRRLSNVENLATQSDINEVTAAINTLSESISSNCSCNNSSSCGCCNRGYSRRF